MRNGNSAATYWVFAADFDGNGKPDLATLSPNGGGGWADWIALELSTGTGFNSHVWGAVTPQHIRNGNNTRSYIPVTGDFNGDGKTDIATVSPDGGGGWASWLSVDRSTRSALASAGWTATTPQHMRNGMR